jgi:hypothetical protein
MHILRTALAFALILTMTGCAGTSEEKPDATAWAPSGGVEDALEGLGIGHVQFPAPFGHEQEGSNWCWAAAVSGALNALLHKDVISQEEVVRELFGGLLLDQGAYTHQIVGAINGKSFSRPFSQGGRSIIYTVSAYSFGGIPTPEQIKSLDDGNHAVIALVPQHAVVLAGAQWEYGERDRAKTRARWKSARYSEFTIWDPWPLQGRQSVPARIAMQKGNRYSINDMVVISVRERVE